MNEDTRTILGKLMNDALDEDERRRLLYDPRVTRAMRAQWDEAGNRLDPAMKRRVWKRIMARTRAIDPIGRQWIYKITAVAASILLLLGVGGAIYWSYVREDRYIYVMTSGICCVESVTLSDGTKVKIGPNSQLIYPDKFREKARDVELKGQAFFDVAKDPARPFSVHTKNMDVTALGTAFEVFDHDSENKLETILLRGKVRIGLGGPDAKERREVILNPNEMLVYDKRSNALDVKTVDAENYSAWHKGVLAFENERLSMILARLETWFGRRIKCPEKIAEEYRFTFKVRNESLEQILYMLSTTSPIRYREKDNEYELYIEER